MRKVWEGHIDTRMIGSYARVQPAAAYLMEPQRRTILAYNEDRVEPYFVAFPRTLFLAAGCYPYASCLSVTALEKEDAGLTPDTILYPFPLPNCYPHGGICLGKHQPFTHEESINAFFQIPFEMNRFLTNTFTYYSKGPYLLPINRCSTFREWAEQSRLDPDFGTRIRAAMFNTGVRFKDLIAPTPPIPVGTIVRTRDKYRGPITGAIPGTPWFYTLSVDGAESSYPADHLTPETP